MGGLDVLIVEDDADMRVVLGEVLRRAGHAVYEAMHGQHALDLLRADCRPNLILLDIIMPVMDGLTFLRRKQSLQRITHIPVVVVSATAEPRISGACCVLHKPVDPDDLVETVTKYAAA
jgi:CheY-like chemotaxis protein